MMRKAQDAKKVECGFLKAIDGVLLTVRSPICASVVPAGSLIC